MIRLLRVLVTLAFACSIAPALAQQSEVVDLPTRAGVTMRMLVQQPAQPPAAVLVLMTGGNGYVGIYDNGSMRFEGNFLVRTRSLFVAQGYAVAVVDTPSDHLRSLAGNFRESPEHAADLGAVVTWARQKFGKPVWLVGTSRGTQSVAAAATQLQGAAAPDGIVLTSTIVGRSSFGTSSARPVQDMPVEKLHIPVLVVHHARDTCDVTLPSDLPALTAKLPAGNSQVITYSGGRSAGAVCEAFAWHGFNGIEPQVVADISAWIAAPRFGPGESR